MLGGNGGSGAANTRRDALELSNNAGPGPRGVAVTPDGTTVYVGLVEDGTAAHPTPTVVRVDVTTVGSEKITSSFVVGSTPHNISIQQTLR